MNIDALIDTTATELTKHILENLLSSSDAILKKDIIDRLNVFNSKVAENQFEKDCEAICVNCTIESVPKKDDEEWLHYVVGAKYPMLCSANNIRNKREQEIRILNR